MSFNDEFIAAKKRYLAQQEQEKTKAITKATAKKKIQKSPEWTLENEIVAYYLQKSQSSKFIKENYSKKLKVTVRSMSMRMSMFKDLALGGKPKAVGIHSLAVLEKYGSLAVDELLKVVISILRGEFQQGRSLSTGSNAQAQSEATTIIKRENTPG